MVKVIILDKQMSEYESEFSSPVGTVYFMKYAVIYGSDEWDCVYGGVQIVSYCNNVENKPKETCRVLIEKEYIEKIFKGALNGGD